MTFSNSRGRFLSISAVSVFTMLSSAGCHRSPSVEREGTPSDGTAEPTPIPPPALGATQRCIVHLHGKGMAGSDAVVEGGVTHLFPPGNEPGWKGRKWQYFPSAEYERMRTGLANAIVSAGCAKVVVHGFSNGATAAAKLLCRGESFGDRTIGYIIDDPVPDHAADHCTPKEGVKVRLYVTGALEVATDGWQCASLDWTCEGETTIGITKFAKNLGTTAVPSVNRSHEPYRAPPEYSTWW